MELFLESADVARALGLTPAAVRLRVQHGWLVPDARTTRGWLFSVETGSDALLRETLARRHKTVWHPARQLGLPL